MVVVCVVGRLCVRMMLAVADAGWSPLSAKSSANQSRRRKLATASRTANKIDDCCAETPLIHNHDGSL